MRAGRELWTAAGTLSLICTATDWLSTAPGVCSTCERMRSTPFVVVSVSLLYLVVPLPLVVAGKVLPAGVLAEVPVAAPLPPPVESSFSLLVSVCSGTTFVLSGKVSLSVVTLSRFRLARTWVTAMPGPRVAASIASSLLCTPRS